MNHKEENEKDIYSLDEFINKYEMVKGEENSELEEEENKKENNLSSEEYCLITVELHQKKKNKKIYKYL